MLLLLVLQAVTVKRSSAAVLSSLVRTELCALRLAATTTARVPGASLGPTVSSPSPAPARRASTALRAYRQAPISPASAEPLLSGITVSLRSDAKRTVV